MTSKLKMHSPDLTEDNIAKIAALFPNCISESRDEQGRLKQVVDFDLLRQELSGVIVEGEQERYRLDWVGKKEAILAANAPIAKTLRPSREESVNFDTTENLFIEGDNLDALKLLQENYLGKVKMIYIDPPYNTGEDFIYNDDFAESSEEFFVRSQQFDEEGNHLIANTENNGRFHSDWLSMMYSRLKLARNLLVDDGVIFISCDDNEQANLKRMCDEIFGRQHFLTTISVKLSEATGVKMAHVKKRIPKLKEYILCFKKSDNISITPIMENKSEWDSEYKTVILGINKDELEKIKIIADNENRSKHDIVEVNKILSKCSFATASQICKDETGKELNEEWLFKNAYRIIQFVTMTGGALQQAKEIKLSGCVEGEAFSIITSKNKMYFIRTDFNHESDLPRSKILFADEYLQMNIGDFWKDIKTTGLDNEGGVPFKNGKKPLKLIKRLLSLVTNQNDLILDFFAGSATTADAVMQFNAEDGGNRHFIMVQLPEVIDLSHATTDKAKQQAKQAIKFLDEISKPHTIAEISKERIRRAATKIQADFSDKLPENWDGGFRVLKVDSTNMKDVYYHPDEVSQSDLLDMVSHIKEDRSSEDLLFQVMLDWGLPLSLPIQERDVDGKKVYFVGEKSSLGYALAACFDELNEAVIQAVAAETPQKFVSVEHAISQDADKTNIKEWFKQLSPETDVKFI